MVPDTGFSLPKKYAMINSNLVQECLWHSSVHLCNPLETISDGRLISVTDTSVLHVAYSDVSHLTSDMTLSIITIF